MDWAAAKRRTDPDTLEAKTFGWIQRLTAARKATLALRTGGESEVIECGDGRVLAWRRRHPRSGNFIGLANFATEDAWVDSSRFGRPTESGTGAQAPLTTLLSSDGPVELSNDWVRVPGLGFLWLLDP
jgi:amylosucrase